MVIVNPPPGDNTSPDATAVREWSQQVLLRRGMSVVLPTGNMRLASDETDAAQALRRAYEHLSQHRRQQPELAEPPHIDEQHDTTETIEKVIINQQRRTDIHQQSADLFEHFSPVQKERRAWIPQLSDQFTSGLESHLVELPTAGEGLHQRDMDALRQLHRFTFGLPYLEIAPNLPSHVKTKPDVRIGALRVGLVLSGGPAPGGHNVIAGVYDYLKLHHKERHLFGFLGGLDGFLKSDYRLVDDDLMDNFRNLGGFDMLWSGRGKIRGIEDLRRAQNVVQSLELNGLIIVGGDGSNSNAALLAEYFAAGQIACCVVGVPKTIDGDLQNSCIEISFGFDTAAKTYSELIGNLCTDVFASERTYHFIRVMGRSASHLVLECAMQTRPNLVLIGEEIRKQKISLQSIVDDIVDLIIERQKMGKTYGIILLPEGLIEFIPEIEQLISELNTLQTSNLERCVGDALSEESSQVWKSLPDSIQQQFMTDREASGYIQVAKIATERLLINLTETELSRREVDETDLVFLPHYFGYEGRCAIPSNFDANYCYNLGFTAACLIHKRRNAYMAVVRRLDQHVSMWQPAGVPFTSVMEMKSVGEETPFPGLIRQLVDLDGRLFSLLKKVRKHWRLNDSYRCPGPIQFDGPTANVANFTVAPPKEEELLWGSTDSRQLLRRTTERAAERLATEGVSSAWVTDDKTKFPAVLSELQLLRIGYKPPISPVCVNLQARAFGATEYRLQDPFCERQALLFFPHLCNRNRFQLFEIRVDPTNAFRCKSLRLGAVILSRQSPGCANVLWGLYERTKRVGGCCLVFKGLDGALNGEYVKLTDEIFAVYANQAGAPYGVRSLRHTLLDPQKRQQLREICESIKLDGLVLIGSSLAMTEATLTAEHFLQCRCRTAVVAVPACGSGDIMNELIETNVGFDTSSKVYASLVGNVLTEAASMPKYWHFIRLMGKSPSFEVLEASLQCHPSIVLIAEEYRAAGKTLADVVNDISDVVAHRASLGKNSGAVLIPDGLLTHLPNMNNLMKEFSATITEANTAGKLSRFQAAIASVAVDGWHQLADNFADVEPIVKKVTPWSMALFCSLPEYIQKELLKVEMGEMRFTVVETEMLLADMVQQELQKRKEAGTYSGTFLAVTHFFGYQGRSSLPSCFDANLGFSYGHIAAICVESGLHGYCCTIRRLVSQPSDWKFGAVPLNALLASIPMGQDVHPELQRIRNQGIPIIPSATVSMDCRAYRSTKTVLGRWQLQDRYCNPGPIQFTGIASTFYNRILHEEHAEYSVMLRQVETFVRILGDTCRFGVDRNFLKVVYAQLHFLLTLRYKGDDLLVALPPAIDPAVYESATNPPESQPSMWQPRMHSRSTFIPILSDLTASRLAITTPSGSEVHEPV